MQYLKRTLCVFIVFFLVVHAYCQGQFIGGDSCSEFSLTIHKDGGNNDSIRLLVFDSFYQDRDTIVLTKGTARLHGIVNRASEAVLFTDIHNRIFDGPKTIRFIIEPGRMNLSFSLVNDTVRTTVIAGSASQAEMENWEKALADTLNERYFNSLIGNYQKFAAENNPGMKELYQKKLSSYYENRVEAAIHYIKTHPNSYFSVYLLSHYKRRIPLDSVQAYYSSLSNGVRWSNIGKYLLMELFARTNDVNFRRQNSDPVFFSQLQSIKTLHDITLPTPDGHAYNLSSFKGKYVVVDFWGTGCGPCVANIPYLKKLADEMTIKDVAFISISIDKDINVWKNTLAKYHLPGLNLVDTTGLAATFYKVPWVPKYVIIDPDGGIVSDDAPQPMSGELRPLLLSVMDKKVNSAH